MASSESSCICWTCFVVSTGLESKARAAEDAVIQATMIDGERRERGKEREKRETTDDEELAKSLAASPQQTTKKEKQTTKGLRK
jgi:hypothetical protein